MEQYAFVPARGGILAVDGRLPRRDEIPPARFLRVAQHVEGDPPLRLRQFEGVDADGVPPEGVDVPEPLRAGFEQCVAELRGAPVPAARPPWARPGWHEQAEGWAGQALEQVRAWPLSAVLRNGDTWFKATMLPYFAAEPAVTEAVGMPHVLRADRRRGWMLMDSVPGEHGTDHHGALRAIAAIHRDWAGRVDEALALGAHDRRAPSALPHTLIHGDFHPWNVLGPTIIDWSDAAVANPLHDVNHYLLNVGDEQRYDLLATYSAAWGDDVAAAADACEAETYEWIAQSYARITAALAADDRWWFADEESRWLARASDVRAGRRPNRGT
jgi:Phosphotransferase enzyme family